MMKEEIKETNIGISHMEIERKLHHRDDAPTITKQETPSVMKRL